MNWRRIRGVYLRHFYETTRTKPELFDLAYASCVELIAWGLLTTFLRKGNVHLPIPVAYLIGAAIMWNVFYRIQLAITLTFLKEGWASNMLSLLASPITPGEYITAAMLWALTSVLTSAVIMGLVAQTFFAFGVLTIGFAIAPFVLVLLLFALAISLLVVGTILRFGTGANILVWGFAGLLQPLMAVFFPQRILPGWARAISQLLPPAHVFEGLRGVLAGGSVQWGDIGGALALSVVYVAGAAVFARRMFGAFRARGFVTRYAT